MKKKYLILGALILVFQLGFSNSCVAKKHRYKKINNKIYYYMPGSNEGTKIKNINYRTLKLLDEFGLAKDKNYVYVFGKKIKGLDAKTFEVIELEKRSIVSMFCYPTTAIITKDKNGEYGGALEILEEVRQGKLEIIY